MELYQAYCPVRFIVGADALDALEEICSQRKVLLVYGSSSVHHSGAYERIRQKLEKANAVCIDYGGQKESSYAAIREGVALGRAEAADCVIGVDGSSVMDMAKVISFGIARDDWEDYIDESKEAANEHVLSIMIPTYPSTGSEADGVSDVTCYRGQVSGGLGGVFADYALLVPSLTASLDLQNTAYSVLVTFIQASACWFGNANPILRGFLTVLLKALLDAYETLQEHPDDEQAREVVLWASSLAVMGILRVGVRDFYAEHMYSVGYIPSVLHGIPYRVVVSVAFPHWLQEIAPAHREDVSAFMTDILGADTGLPFDEIASDGL